MHKKFWVIHLTLVVSLALLTQTHAVGAEDENWRPPAPTSLNHKSVTITDSIEAADTFSRLWAEGRPHASRYVCKSIEDPGCSSAPTFNYQAILPVCATTSQSNCVESIASGRVGTALTEGSFVSYNVSDHPNNFRAEEDLGLITNSNPSIWSLSASPHSAGFEYTVAVGIKGYVNSRIQGSGNRVVVSSESDLFGFIVPTRRVLDAGSELAKCIQAPTSALQSGVAANTRCAGSELRVNPALNIKCTFSLGNEDDCLSSVRFPSDQQFRVTIRLADEPVAWVHGRMTEPTISIVKRQGGEGVRLSVTALPAQVPVMHHGVDWLTASSATRKWWLEEAKRCDISRDCYAGGTNPEQPFSDMEKNFISMSVPPYGNFSIDVITDFKEATNDVSASQQSIWSFRTLPNRELVGTNRCIADGQGVKGVVTTNATAYVEGPPTFEDGSLNYRVAALHKLPSGEVFRGTYSLIVRSDVARCLYQFTDAPLKAEVSVVSDTGASSVVTTASREVDGWFTLNAANFTFSSPSIRVRLSQDKTQQSRVEEQEKTVPAVTTQSKKKRIVCIKGGRELRVFAVDPKCPKGFKVRKR